jgi:hypothetical protein
MLYYYFLYQIIKTIFELKTVLIFSFRLICLIIYNEEENKNVFNFSKHKIKQTNKQTEK